MNKFWFLTASNNPRLRDPTQVLEIIARYWFDFECEVEVEQDADGQSRLSIHGDGWPAAWPLPPGTSQEDFLPDFDTAGDEEFCDFLTDIAPFLEETLLVQAIGTVDGHFPFSASEWRIHPGVTAVATIAFTSPAESGDLLLLAAD